MEKLDYYDENLNFIGVTDRNKIHLEGLWHKTIHCWLYDIEGNLYFQIRADSGKLYTTASGHISTGETIDQAFLRELKEEIGIDIEFEKAEMLAINVWKMDKIKNNTLFIDRAFAHIYTNKIDNNFDKFKFDESEVLGIVRINAQKCLDLLRNEDYSQKIAAQKITNRGKENIEISCNDFLVMKGEIAIIKYGQILSYIVNKTSETNI